jgi:hypothetical protein
MDVPHLADDPAWRQRRDWMVETFPAEVLRHFNMLEHCGAADAG